jgi:hypothetical protein
MLTWEGARLVEDMVAAAAAVDAVDVATKVLSACLFAIFRSDAGIGTATSLSLQMFIHYPIALVVCSALIACSQICRPEDLRAPFERFGPVRDIYLPRDYYTG